MTPYRSQFRPTIRWYEGAESVMLVMLGSLLLFYRIRNQLTLLIHENYIILATLTGIFLLTLGLYRGIRILQFPHRLSEQHTSLIPPRLGISLLVITAFLGLLITPKPLSSQTALNRGLSQQFGIQEVQTQTFQPRIDSSQRSLIEWIRTIEIHPDPRNYEGQAVDIDGFIIYLEEPGAESFYIGRFLIRCCAADAYPVGLPVIFDGELPPVDSWQRIQGSMAVDETTPPRLIVQADTITAIPTPTNPYSDS